MDIFLGNMERQFGTIGTWFLLGFSVVVLVPFILELIKYIKNSWHELKKRWTYRWKDRWGWNSWKKRWGNSWLGRNFDFTALVIVLSIFVFVYCVYPAEFLVWVSSEAKKYKTIEHYVFNNPLVLAALIGFPILIRRVSEVQKQTRALQYNAANELLWSKNLGSRMAGIDALWRVAETYPKEEYKKVMDVFTQFVKHPVSYEWGEGTKKEAQKAGKRKDINAILWHLREERLEESDRIDLSGANLEGADLCDANLWGVALFGTRLEGAILTYAYLGGALLDETHLEETFLFRTDFIGAYLQGCHLKLAIINDANFADAKGLRQEQINECVFITDRPHHKERPKLPDGIEHKYRNMTIKEWEAASGRKYNDFFTWDW